MAFKKIVSIVLVLLCMLSIITSAGISVHAQGEGLKYGNYTYEMYTDNSVIITDYIPMSDEEDTLRVPDKINGYPVVALGDNSLSQAWEKNIILPDTVEIIGNNVYYNSGFIKYVHISKSVKSIGVNNIELGYTVDKNNPYFKAVDGVLFSKDGKTLIDYPTLKEGREYNVPDGVEYIGERAFYNTVYIEIVNLPEGLKGIEKEAFASCSRLGGARWPMSLEYVMDKAYADCQHFTSIYGYDSFSYIAPDAFENTRWYEQQPSGCIYLGSLVYGYKRSGFDVDPHTLLDGTTRIGPHAFGSSGPSTLTIPASVVYIDPSAFYDAWEIDEIIVDEDNPYYASVDGMLFDKEKKILITIPKGLHYEVNIPECTEIIYPMAGYGCDFMHAVIIPESVYYIGESAFESCGWLTRAEIKGKLDYLGDRAFAENLSMKKVDLPGGELYYVGKDIFTGCKKLDEINIPEGCASYSANDFKYTPWYNRNTKIVMLNNNVLGYNYNNGKLKELVIPEGAVAIGREAFKGHSKLSKVEISDTVTIIGRLAFANCPELKEVYIPATVDEIGIGAFGFNVTLDEDTRDIVSFEKIEGFVIKGYTNSIAESYADANGFEFVSVGYMEPESTLLGDIDCDGRLTVKDATALQKYVAGMVGLNTQDKINADFNGDGKINVRDATAIQKRLARLD